MRRRRRGLPPPRGAPGGPRSARRASCACRAPRTAGWRSAAYRRSRPWRWGRARCWRSAPTIRGGPTRWLSAGVRRRRRKPCADVAAAATAAGDHARAGSLLERMADLAAGVAGVRGAVGAGDGPRRRRSLRRGGAGAGRGAGEGDARAELAAGCEREAWLLARRGDLEGARRALERGLAASEAAGLAAAGLRARLGRLLVTAGRFAEALAIVEPSLAATAPWARRARSPRRRRCLGAPTSAISGGRVRGSRRWGATSVIRGARTSRGCSRSSPVTRARRATPTGGPTRSPRQRTTFTRSPRSRSTWAACSSRRGSTARR